MDVIAYYIPKLADYEDKATGCQEIITAYLDGFEEIKAELASAFITKYFLSALTALAAEVDLKNAPVIDRLIRTFIKEQDGIWDLFSTLNYQRHQWKTMERCLEYDLKIVKSKPVNFVTEYVLAWATRLRIEIYDAVEQSYTRVVDYARYRAANSQNVFWKYMHIPIINCSVLPGRIRALRLFLRFGAAVPADATLAHYITTRLCNPLVDVTKEEKVLRLQWISLICVDVSCNSKLWWELQRIAQSLAEMLGVTPTSPKVPSLKYQSRFAIRNHLRRNWGLPFAIDDLEIPTTLKSYLTLEEV